MVEFIGSAFGKQARCVRRALNRVRCIPKARGPARIRTLRLEPLLAGCSPAGQARPPTHPPVPVFFLFLRSFFISSQFSQREMSGSKSRIDIIGKGACPVFTEPSGSMVERSPRNEGRNILRFDFIQIFPSGAFFSVMRCCCFVENRAIAVYRHPSRWTMAHDA